MALSDAEKLTLVVILAVMMVIVVYFEMRVMRRKSKEVRQANLKKDEAYNDILTTKSVINSLSNQGRNTTSASILVERAKSAMDRGDYDTCVDLCARSRSELTNPSKGVAPLPSPVADDDAGDSLQKVAEGILSEELPSAKTDAYKGTKLNSASEGNYLGAKFEMSAARAEISRSAKSGIDTSRAEDLMSQSDSAFSSGNYDKALSFAVRAKRSLKGDDGEAIRLKTVAEEEAEEAASEAEVYDVEEEKTPSGFKCKNCGTVIDPTDLFCGSCGARTSQDRVCKNCGAKAKPEDTFCRKCGERI